MHEYRFTKRILFYFLQQQWSICSSPILIVNQYQPNKWKIKQKDWMKSEGEMEEE